MSDPFIRKLEHGAALTDADRQVLARAVTKVEQVEADKDLIRKGDKPEHVHTAFSKRCIVSCAE